MKLEHTYEGFKIEALERCQTIERMIDDVYIENPSEKDIENMRKILDSLSQAREDLFLNIVLTNIKVTRI